jgi:hypothetical protein
MAGMAGMAGMDYYYCKCTVVVGGVSRKLEGVF